MVPSGPIIGKLALACKAAKGPASKRRGEITKRPARKADSLVTFNTQV